jgi:2-polyprenyl-3-methyl-5-hydroxy-6-metoxy-1,4-benzoquinol methylase
MEREAILDEALSRCAICGSAEIRPWFSTDFGAIGRCGACRQVLRADRPGRDDQVELHQTSDLHETPYATLGAQASEHLPFYGGFLDLFERPGKVLDVGVGTGEFLEIALERGFDAIGIEPVPEVLRMTEERLGIEGRIDSRPVEESEHAPESLDGVAMWDVIEHLVDPRGALERLHGMIRPGGFLGVATINHASLMYVVYHVMRRTVPPLARRFGPLLYNPFHTYYFSKGSLRKLVENAGFEVLEQRGYEFPLSRLDVSPALKLGMRGLYVAQGLFGAQGEQYLFARKP